MRLRSMRHVVHGVCGDVLKLVCQRTPPMGWVHASRCRFFATGLSGFGLLRFSWFGLMLNFGFHLWLGFCRSCLCERILGLRRRSRRCLLWFSFERVGQVVEAHIHALQGVERHALHFEGLNGGAHRFGVLL